MTRAASLFPLVVGHARRFLADEQGTTAIEYALLASCIAVAIVSTVLALGSNLRDNMYAKVLSAFPG